jgi:hypothetical protein
MTENKVMFEIYRESEYNSRFHVVYFTELTEGNKEFEINRAMAGEHFLDGFFFEDSQHEAKEKIRNLIDELNSGMQLSESDAANRLESVLAS